MIHQLEADGIDWHSVAEIWAKERGCRPEDVAPGILAAAALGGWGDFKEPVEPGVCREGMEVWRCNAPVLLPGWPGQPKNVNFVLSIQGPASQHASNAMQGCTSAATPPEGHGDGDEEDTRDDEEAQDDAQFGRGLGAQVFTPGSPDAVPYADSPDKPYTPGGMEHGRSNAGSGMLAKW